MPHQIMNLMKLMNLVKTQEAEKSFKNILQTLASGQMRLLAVSR